MHYVGKDVVHRGAALALDPSRLDESLAHSAKKNVRKAQRAGFSIERREGSPEELDALRALWYFPEDPNFPQVLSEGDVLYMAYLDDDLVGGMILVPVGQHYFLNNLLANDRGKANQLQALLLWNGVHDLADSGKRYIDIGVSYRPNLQRFFQKWASFTYPVIFHPPEHRPRITQAPFQRLAHAPEHPGGAAEAEAAIDAFVGGRPYTLLPSRGIAKAVLTERGLDCTEVAAPGLSRADHAASSDIELMDLTQALPVAHGALLIGLKIETAELWSEHGCYDFVKTEYLRRVVADASTNWDSIQESRTRTWTAMEQCFKEEDVEIAAAGPFPLTFALRSDAGQALHERYRSFGVESYLEAGWLHLPCHQELNEAEIEYMYAIFRGHLNLCSAWESTQVRGRLTLDVK